MSQANVPEDYVLVGQLGKTFQLAGFLRFYPLGEAEAAAVLQAKRVFITGIGLSDIRGIRQQGQQIMIALSNALNVETAKALVNRELYLPQADLPMTEDAVYLDLLIDLPVLLDDTELGRVSEVLAGDVQDILIVEGDGGQLLLPLQAPYVQVEEDHIRLVNPPEGLLELNA